ncbi:MAG TPA: glycosyltransferase [Acidimicrobiales bacterium]|nr:glycosyltransferase [Acidimicrobiales bacterium]
MPLISVLTAAAPGRESLLSRALQSVVAQELPAGWQWEWVVQYDGESPRWPEHLIRDERVSLGSNGRNFGTAITRNLGLARVQGRYVRVLDDDDELLDGALHQDLDVLESADEVWWTSSRAIDTYADGRTHIPADAIPPGRITIGGLLDPWLSAQGIPPVHPATLCARTQAVRAFGGWMALPVSDDVGLLLAMSSLLPGYFAPNASLRYHKSDFQITANDYARSPTSKAQRMDAIVQRVESMGALRQVFVPLTSGG